MSDETPPQVVPAQLGRFFEDFEVGTVYQHPFGRTISEADSTWFTLLTCNTNQNHFNAHLAQSNPITGGRIIVNSGFTVALVLGLSIIVNSGLTVALVLGLSVIDMSQNAVANLGWTDIKLTHPVYIGDTIYAESICLETRESSSRPEMGIIRMKTRGLNQDGDEIVSWFRSVMVPKRSSGIGQDYFPTAVNGPMGMPEG
jgi:itaconyl-CoA hydratase